MKSRLLTLLVALVSVPALQAGTDRNDHFKPDRAADDVPVILVDEPFTDGALTGGDDPLDATWYAATGSTTAIVDDSGGLGSGNAMETLSTGNFSRVTAAFDAPIALTNTGDLITLEVRLRMTRFSESNTGGIRFGLHHDNGGPITPANSGQSWTDRTDGWDGYYFRGGVGTDTGMRIYKDVPVAGNSAMGGSGDITIESGTAWALSDMAVHTARIEIDRTANGQNQLRFYWDDDLKQDSTTSTVGGEMSAFTNFTIGTGSTEVDLVVDDLIITLTEGADEPPKPIDLAARMIDWTRAGVEGDIPDYPNVINFDQAGGDKTGQTNNAPLLQEMIDGLTEDTVIYLPAGVYRFDRRVSLSESSSRDLPGVIIRGAGTRDTKLLFMDSAAEDAGLFDVTGYPVSSEIPIESELTKGSTSITLQSVSGVSVGGWLAIRQDNDADAMATTRAISDYLDSIDNVSGWARRVVGQVVKVTAIDGNSVTLDRPLHLDFTWANPTVTVIGMIEGIGFEDFTLENGSNAAKRINFDFRYAANSWIKNVHSLMAVRFHLATEICANLTVRDSYFNDAYRHDGGGHGYGTLIADTATHCLIVNNVFRNLRHSISWKEGANGNVFAYNFSTDGKWDGSGVAKDVSGHGHYAFGNLFEGNIVQFIHASDFWGPIGPNNFFLRNRTTDERILIEDRTKDQSIIGNELISPTSSFVIVDSSSTDAYIHGNSEGGLIQWREGEEQAVADSFFYSEQPAFWDIADPWPSIGPEHEAGSFTIPAKYRWDNKLMDVFDPPVPLISQAPASAAADIGGEISFAVEAITHGTNIYQWTKDGVDLADGDHVAGSATANLFLSNLSPSDAGSYTLVISNERGSATSESAVLSIWSPDDGRLLNLSTRGQVLAGDGLLIGGFVISGSTAKTMLIRGIGPSLGLFIGAGKAVEDSAISVFSSGSEILSNDDWGTQMDPDAIGSLTTLVGAFPLDPESKDAALQAEFEPGAYSVHLSGKGEAGLALVELYDGSAENGDARLMNISTRGKVGTGDSIMVPGIVVRESVRPLLIRGIGPELSSSFGLNKEDVLPDPVLTLKDQDGVTVATNDDWGSGSETAMITAVSQQVGAFPLTEDSADAVLLIEVPAGVYTALVTDATGQEGIAIVEVYAAP